MAACPFCGQRTDTKEHAWPQFLRKYSAYEALDAGRHGERFARTEFSVDDMAPQTRSMHEGLPKVTADVCGDCNHGWMSRMDNDVKQLLDAAMRTDDLVGPELGADEQLLLAAWFTKCAYAYEAAMFSERNRAWPPQAYRDLRETLQAPSNATIWIGKSVGLLADIVLSTSPLYMISIETRASLEIGWPKLVSAWLSANSVVMFGLWVDSAVDGPQRAERLASDDVDAMRAIWPARAAIAWPDAYTTDEQAIALVNRLPSIRETMGIDLHSLSAKEIERRRKRSRKRARRDGFDPPFMIVNQMRATR